MPIICKSVPDEYSALAQSVVLRLAGTGGPKQTFLAGRQIEELSLGFPQHIHWLGRKRLLAGGGWNDCIAEGGWRFLLIGDGTVIGAISVWDSERELRWSIYWGGWATATADAVMIASQRQAVVDTPLEPRFLRVRTLNQGALWLCPADGQPGIVIPLPDTAPPLQSLTLVTQDYYLEAVRDQLRVRAKSDRGDADDTRPPG